MRKLFSVLVMCMASLPAGIMMIVGLLSLDIIRAFRQAQERKQGLTYHVKPAADHEARVQESEFAVINRGVTITKGHRL